jgi:hypothetical protein
MKTRLFISFAACVLFIGAGVPTQSERQNAAPQSQKEPVDKLCPTIYVSCPDTPTNIGVPIKFTAKISRAGPPPSLTLNWIVSAGAISSGQNQTHISAPDSTTEITVDTTGLNAIESVTATVAVDGLARSCAGTVSCTTPLLFIQDPVPIDEYGDIPFSDEQARLDNFAIELQGDPTDKGYIDCYGGRKGYRGEAMARCERAKKYLVNRRRISADRVVLVDGGFRENLMVVLWVLPPNVRFMSSPTVSPSEVQFINGPQKQKKHAAQNRRSGE